MNKAVDLGLLTAEEFVTRRSETLIKDPKALLNEAFEVERYLSTFDEDYNHELIALSQIETVPLAVSIREIITIIAYNEGSRIRQTLENYVGQDLDPSQFEIIILDNHPVSQSRDTTREEIEHFRHDNPAINLIYAYRIWNEGELATVGNARRYVFDIALKRIGHRGGSDYETVLISNDADTVSIDDNYLSSIIEVFDQHKVVDALVTLNLVPFQTIIKPNAYAALTFWDTLDAIVAEGEPYNLIGSTSAYRASIFAAIGGYNPKGRMAGDLETGFMIADARNWNPDCVIQFKGTKHVQDPRRMLEAIASRIPVNEMYYKFVSNPEIRNANNDVLLTLISDDLDWELLEEDLDSFWAGNTTGMYKWRGQRFKNDYHQAMKRLGIEYEVVDNHVKLLSIDRLLKAYQAEFDILPRVIRSQSRKHDETRMAEMGRYFSSVADSAIQCRQIVADGIASEIVRDSQSKPSNDLGNLLKRYERFAGHAYQEGN